MKSVIEKYTTNKNGLILFDLPTGYGKSTKVKEFIKDKILDDDYSRTIFYVTNLKSNLPTDLSNDLDKKYADKVLYLLPYAETVISKWEEVSINQPEIKQSVEFKVLDKSIKRYIEIKKSIEKQRVNESGDKNTIKNNDSIRIDQDRLKDLYDKISKYNEVEFRKLLRRQFFNSYEKSDSDKKKFIEENEWFRILYPSCELDKYKVIYMTTSKFFSTIDPFLRRSFFIYNSDIVQGSIVFLDEFDETKKVSQGKIIEAGLKYEIDVLKLFFQIHQSLKSLNHPSQFNNATTIRDVKYKDVQSVLSLSEKKFDECCEKNNLKSHFKTIGFNNHRIFLFDEKVKLAVTKGTDYKKLYVEKNRELNLNVIKKDYNKNSEGFANISDVIHEVTRALSFFFSGVEIMSNIYHWSSEENLQKKDDYLTKEQSIWTVLNLFNLSEKYSSMIYEIVINFDNQGALKYDKDQSNNTFYQKGFEFITVEDSDYHSLQSRIKMIKFYTTPEDLLMRVCNNAFVVGLSATATIETVLGNYDIGYLKRKLRSNYFELNKEDVKKLSDRYKEMIEIYESDYPEIECTLVGDYHDLPEDSITSRRLLMSKYLDIDDISKNKDLLQEENSFNLTHIIKLGYMYYQMLQDCSFDSLVYFLNKFPRYDSDLDKRRILKLFDFIESKYLKEKVHVHFVESSNVDDELSKIKINLYNNKKVFIITTYQTLGTGKNIQYDITDEYANEPHLVIRNWKELTKDFDAIFLTTPTNLSQNIYGEVYDKSLTLSKVLFEQQYLYYKSDKKDRQTLRKNIEKAFRRIYFGEKKWLKRVDSDRDYYTAKVIIQAIGRICRTKNKNKKINVFSDTEIVRRISRVKIDLLNRFNNKEFLELLKLKPTVYNYNLNQLTKINNSTSKILTNESKKVRSSNQRRREWQRLRDYVLKHPTALSLDLKYKDYYFEFEIDVNEYACKTRDKKIIDVTLDTRRNSYKRISEKDCDLSSLMKVPFIRRFFNNHNYATTFLPRKHIMSYALYQQIYKGALGEVVGLSIFRKYGIDVHDVSDDRHYEYFDFQYGNVYIDFKHWRMYEKKLNEAYRNIYWKSLRVKPEKVIILNIMQRGNHQLKFDRDKNILRIPYLVYEDKGEYKVNESYLKEIKEFIGI